MPGNARLPLLDDRPRSQDLPTVLALDALWTEVCARPLWAPPRFWRYVKLRWRMRLEPIDPQRVPVTAPRGKVNDCVSCTEICCVGPRSTVLLRLRDIATLIDLGRTDLMSRAKPEITDDLTEGRPALKRTLGSRTWATFPVLRQNSFGACMALTDAGKCSLYPNWPISCERFPYAFHADRPEVFYSKRCDSFWILPDADHHVARMAHAAVEAFNDRIRDSILLEFAPQRLTELGLTTFLTGRI